jgi:hypothetical protein
MKKVFKFFLISTFFSYYFVAVALNFPWINEHLNLLKHFNAQHLVSLNEEIYIGSYPDSKDLKKYKEKFGLERVVTLLDPNFPLSRELVREEKEQCEKLNLELIVIPISFFSQNPMDYVIIEDLLDEEKKVTLIHTYYMDQRLQILQKMLERYLSV